MSKPNQKAQLEVLTVEGDIYLHSHCIHSSRTACAGFKVWTQWLEEEERGLCQPWVGTRFCEPLTHLSHVAPYETPSTLAATAVAVLMLPAPLAPRESQAPDLDPSFLRRLE